MDDQQKSSSDTVILFLNSKQHDLLLEVLEDYIMSVENIFFISPNDSLARKRLRQYKDIWQALQIPKKS